jgi:NAD-dependent deacetylase
MTDLDDIREQVASAHRIAVLTGAGLSTDSGIPDFRGPNGLWTKSPEAQRLSNIDAYVSDPAVRVRAWQGRRAHAAWSAVPNAGHRAFVDLERSGRLSAIATQNIDGLHQAAGSSPQLVLELHGTIWEVECLRCSRLIPMRDALARLDAGESDPPCEICGGILKSATISFGQALEPDIIDAARHAAEACEIFLAVGSTLQVQPAAGLCEVAVRAGARLYVINADATPYDDLAAISGGDVLRGSLSEILPVLLSGLP